ncbi:MAG: hypothetical protein HZA89_03720 [Verrucomicrobia bacterium]|nr:hypothetical protein [Verrucomicrobiota bacterium]
MPDSDKIASKVESYFSAQFSPQQRQIVVDEIFAGRTLVALKHYYDVAGREGIRLSEAQDIIIALEKELKRRQPEKFMPKLSP